MISVVIPLYNKEHSIQRTLKTVLDQTFTDFEVVIVNDGSTDNGVKVIRESFNDPRIVIVEQQNQGVSSARNNGVAAAKFDYVAFLDGDDEWAPGYLECMKGAIDKFPHAGMFCCGGIVRNADGSQLYRLAKKYMNKTIEINFFENPHVFVHTSATVVSRSEFNKTIGFPLGMKRNQDYALFFSLALITPVVYCGYPLSTYVGGVEGQATSTPMKQVLKHVIDRFNMVFKNWENTKRRNKVFKIFMKYDLRHMILSDLKKNDYEAVEILLKNLDAGILKCLGSMEVWMYKQKSLKAFAIYYIYLTKVRWRMRGYPYFGQKI